MWASAGGEGLSTWASRLGSVLLHRMTARSVMVMDVAAAGTAPQSERRVERERESAGRAGRWPGHQSISHHMAPSAAERVRACRKS